jgi:Hemocyanin, ig-like domain
VAFIPRVPHLQHIPFEIILTINNNSVSNLEGMVRVFMAPKHDERGDSFMFNDQRLFMIEIDKFKETRKCVSRSHRNSLRKLFDSFSRREHHPEVIRGLIGHNST